MNDVGKGLSLDDVCTLVKVTVERSANGGHTTTKTRRELYCTRKHINQSEFFKAHQEGLRSDLCLIIYWDEYEGEQTVEYNGKSYAVYRVFERGDDMAELYCGERAGVNGSVS